MEKKEDSGEVQKLMASKFEAIEQLHLERAKLAKINAELARLGRVSDLPAVASW